MLGTYNKKFLEKGMTLIEALVSTAIVAIGFIALFQMVSYSVQAVDVSNERTKTTVSATSTGSKNVSKF